MRERLTQFDIMAAFDRDRATWSDIRHYPDIVTCRRMLRFADWAAKAPRDHEAAQLCYEAPELSYREIAAMQETPYATLMRRIAPVYMIDDPEDFSDREIECAPALRKVSAPAERGRSETYRNAQALAGFVKLDPVRWRVIRFACDNPGTSQEQIAEIFKISQPTICRYLKIERIKSCQSEL